MDQILPLLPKLQPEARYFEPFLGGGAVYFGLSPRRAVLSDVNRELIETFTAVRDGVDCVISRLRTFTNDAACYYRVRSSRPRTPAARAARFIYLNKTCFNGLYRVNLRGEFNVPFGRHGARLLICDEDQLRSASDALRMVDLVVDEFSRVVGRARPDDLVYFDPPYTTAHTDNGFIEYNAKVFSWRDQRKLADVASRLVERRIHVAVSNADHPSIENLYKKSAFKINRIERWSTMAGKSRYRFPTTELLVVSR